MGSCRRWGCLVLAGGWQEPTPFYLGRRVFHPPLHRSLVTLRVSAHCPPLAPQGYSETSVCLVVPLLVWRVSLAQQGSVLVLVHLSVLLLPKALRSKQTAQSVLALARVLVSQRASPLTSRSPDWAHWFLFSAVWQAAGLAG